MRKLAGGVAVLAAFVWLAGCHSRPAPPPQDQFASPEAAGQALAQAARQDNTAALRQIFGPEGNKVLSPGDEAHERQIRQRFANAYQRMHRWATAPSGAATLYVGAENWPFPVPLVSSGGKWQFDTAAGVQQILARRIGRNENFVQQVCAQLIAAENSYHARMHRYAQHFVSDPGQRNGLFWSQGASANPAPDSPIGPLLAFASRQGAAKAKHAPAPFHGYYYHMLQHSGSGYAFVAYPAVYRSSGVMTFLVTQKGDIYEKDLGPDSATAAHALPASTPDASWTKISD